MYPDLLAEAQRHPALGEALMNHVGRPWRAHAVEVLERAAKRGELAVGAARVHRRRARGAGVLAVDRSRSAGDLHVSGPGGRGDLRHGPREQSGVRTGLSCVDRVE
ncbi:TetR-like C-terminal domain-containing protein [Mycolicibacterium doricum]|uniref:TetR-like C-terminal domain-containing protein n=1 Tax=Mycolicibacterium doricum TaxID=126673 RepID=UPI001F18ADC8|nr:TetR-like C-terminal domain-containing protein [Mycolicibacterium doricum]